MSHTYRSARDAMLKVFKDIWDTTGYPALYSDTVGEPPTSAGVYARATIRHADGGQASLNGADGSKLYENEGTVWIQVFGPVGSGLTAAYDAAQLVADAYKRSRDIDVSFYNVRINEVGTNKGYEQINVLADFQYDEVIQ